MKINEMRSEVITLMRSKNPLAVFNTHEENRALSLLSEIGADPKVNRSVHVWTITKGLTEIGKKDPILDETTQDPIGVLNAIEAAKSNGTGKIFALLDYQEFMKDPVVLRKIRDLSNNLKNTKKSIVFISSELPIPGDLQKSISVFDLPLPDRSEIEVTILKVMSGITDQITAHRDELKITPEYADQINANIAELVKIQQKIDLQWDEKKTEIIDACSGLTIEEIENIISRAMIERDLNIPQILKEKKQILKKSGNLEYFSTDQSMNEIGGVGELKRGAIRAARANSKEAQSFGVPRSRGFLLAGSPGTGKSLFCKAISNLMQLPLVRLDLAAMRTKWFGESGQNLIKSLKTLHAIAPCIVWVDEIEKSISRSGNQSMHQEDASMLGTILTDMEENNDLFWIATTNNPEALPAELISRFGKTYFVDLPTKKERAEIFKIQIKAVKRDPAKFNLELLADRSPGYSGREIRNIIQNEALPIAFERGSELTTEIILEQIPRITPISKQKEAEINAMRIWSANNAIRANDPEETTEIAPVRKLDVI